MSLRMTAVRASLAGLPLVMRCLVEVAKDGVPTTGRDCGHVEDIAHSDATAADGAAPLPRSAVLGEGGNADQSRDLFVRHPAQRGQMAEQGHGCHRPDTLH